MPDDRVFSEKEIGDILRRAVELQERPEARSAYTPGVTLGELRRIAEEVGVDPECLTQAIREHSIGESQADLVRILGIDWAKEFERVVPGEVDPNDFDVLVERSVPRLSPQHQTVQFGRSLETWLSSGLGYGRARIQSRNGRTRLNVRSNTIWPALIVLHPTLVGTAIASTVIMEKSGLPVGQSHAAAGLLWLGAAAFAWATLRHLAGRAHDRIAKATDELAVRIAEVAKEPQQPASAVEASVAERLEQST
jgi:hypothetical protein